MKALTLSLAAEAGDIAVTGLMMSAAPSSITEYRYLLIMIFSCPAGFD
jgi:hypothetical protein